MANKHNTLTSLFDDIADAIRANSNITEQIKADTYPAYIHMLGYDGTIPATPSVLNSCSWDFIRWASDEGIADLLWSIGDAKQITINGTIGTKSYSGYNPWVYILEFNHNAGLEGNNKIHFGCFRRDQNYNGSNSIALDDDKYNSYSTASGYFVMNTSTTNSGGWESCQMRTIVLNSNASSPSSASNNSFLKALPSDLKSVLKQCTKYTDNVGGGSNLANNVTGTKDWLWLLSNFEVQGVVNQSNSAEQNYQKQYQYYKNGNSKIKYRHSNTGSAAYWWLRSVVATNSRFFCRVGTDGGATVNVAHWSFGVAPGFCV